MAEIPVERKRERKAFPWIWLLPLLLIPLVYLLTRPGDRRDDARIDTTRDSGIRSDATPETTPAAGTTATGAVPAGGSSVLGDSAGTHGSSQAGAATITDVATYFSAADRRALEGRGMDLSNVEVRRVVSDRGFTVGPTKEQELFVMLDDRLNQGASESRISIKPGQHLAIGGTLMDPPSAETREERYRGLSAKEERELRAQDLYLHAASIAQAR